MAQTQILRIVVASPSDVQAERDLLPDIIEELNRGIAGERGLRLELSRWETDAYPGFHPGGPQGLIDPILKITECDLLIGIFWKRFGTPTPDGKTGTEHEFWTAYETWKEKGRPQIMVYFSQTPHTPKSRSETDQWGQVLEFQYNFPKDGFWWPYSDKVQFEKLVRNHLTSYIRSLPKPDGGDNQSANDQAAQITVLAGGLGSAGRGPDVRIESHGDGSVAAQNIVNSAVNVTNVFQSTGQARTPAHEFRYRTGQTLRRTRTKLTGIEYFHPRPELENIEAQFRAGRPVLLSGEPGSGKSAIGGKLAEGALSGGKEVLLLDSRNAAHFKDEMELRNYFGSSNPLSEVIREIGGDCGFRLIIDQLDNLIGLGAANLLTGLAEECAGSDGVDVVVISRNRQAREVDMLRRLTATGFIEIESQGLRDEEVVAILKILGITNVSQGLIGLGRNLLNLEIICIIKQQRPDFAFAAIPDEITLWDKYVDVLQEREGGLESADQLIGAAMNLARQCLKSEEMSVVFDGPLRAAERRLESWNVIVCEEEFVYRFK